MSDIERLLASFESGELLHPVAELPNLVDLSRAVAAAAGVEGLDLTPAAAQVASLIGNCDHLVLILADGLGMNLVEAMPEGAFLPAHVAGELRTVFPSTTAVALTSLVTGAWPNQHAVTGRWVHLPEAAVVADVLPFVLRGNGRPLGGIGVGPEDAFPLPSLLGNMPRPGLALLPERIANSTYSAYSAGDMSRQGYRTLTEGFDAIWAHTSETDGPSFTYLYTSRIDEAAHAFGLGRSEVRGAAMELDRAVEGLAQRLGGRARIVLTADHGFLDAPQAARHQIGPAHPLRGFLRSSPSGDARVMYFHLRAHVEEPFHRNFKQMLGDRFFLISTDEAEHTQLFGPGELTPETRRRVGDVMAISSGVDILDYHQGGGLGRMASLPSHHSGLTPVEMRVPLVVI